MISVFTVQVPVKACYGGTGCRKIPHRRYRRSLGHHLKSVLYENSDCDCRANSSNGRACVKYGPVDGGIANANIKFADQMAMNETCLVVYIYFIILSD